MDRVFTTNFAAQLGPKGGESGSYDDWTVADLKTRAKELGLSNDSGKTRSGLVKALRDH